MPASILLRARSLIVRRVLLLVLLIAAPFGVQAQTSYTPTLWSWGSTFYNSEAAVNSAQVASGGSQCALTMPFTYSWGSPGTNGLVQGGWSSFFPSGYCLGGNHDVGGAWACVDGAVPSADSNGVVSCPPPCPSGETVVNGQCETRCQALVGTLSGVFSNGYPVGSAGNNILSPIGSATIVNGGYNFAAKACNTGNGCEYTPSSQPEIEMASGPELTYNADGNTCPSSEPTLDQGADATGSNGCAESNGSTLCPPSSSSSSGGSSGGQNCGTFNGESVCLSAPPTNSCTSTPGGQVFCSYPPGNNPPSPPAPDDGTAGQAATPDGVICDPTNQTCTYTYNNTTVGSSTNYGHGSSGSSGGGSSGSSGTGGASSGTGAGTGNCTSSSSSGSSSGSNCGSGSSGSGFTSPGVPSVNDFGTSLTTFYSAIQASPIAQAMNGLSDSVPAGGGQLPAYQVCLDTLNGLCVTIGPDPQAVQQMTGLQIFFLAMWALTAIVVFFKA